ncbi:hypothetical protein QN372_00455 [Undibacterium sp. RTI2.1]|uniref:hypothetical protein n=1 Tax=unclassified Undibacterium TaxID=2630295 RepID=UPI002B222867|nr:MULTISPECIES: hypothetical protein [unclassified Undibacterium]MEB0029210.1 hypothetical protein [Undibacterium sp. RTI2.1]MEB0115518.1 hypothetical protein [Undibacterium sp. RTI2.2]
MKLRITQLGFEGYSGQMGVINFEDGLSTADVLVIDAVRMSAVMLCEWEDGTSVSITQSIIDNAHSPAPMFVSGAEGQHDTEKVETAKNDQTSKPVFTEEQLSVLADSEGIKGLRALGDPIGVKGNSIKDLIAALIDYSKV